MSKLRVYVVEITLPEEVDEDDTWRAIGTALSNEGFENFLYVGPCDIIEGDTEV